METVITRDTDILREYIAALDARERGMSPFARLAATVKLARLRRELNAAQLEATDDDLVALRREIDERTQRSFMRRVEARTWGARLVIFLMLVVGFFFFFMTPLLALLVLFGGRFFRSWRKTLPAVLLTVVISALATYFVF